MGPLVLPSTGLVYLDTSSLIYSVERVEPYRTLLEPMWQGSTGWQPHYREQSRPCGGGVGEADSRWQHGDRNAIP